jgi:hypothetical protein
MRIQATPQPRACIPPAKPNLWTHSGLTVSDQHGRSLCIVCPTADERDCWVKNIESLSASAQHEGRVVAGGASKEGEAAPLVGYLTAEEIEEMERQSREDEMEDFEVLRARRMQARKHTHTQNHTRTHTQARWHQLTCCSFPESKVKPVYTAFQSERNEHELTSACWW